MKAHSPEAQEAVRRVMLAIVETVHEASPSPVSESFLYLALQSSLGISHHACATLVGALVRDGILVRDSHFHLRLGNGQKRSQG